MSVAMGNINSRKYLIVRLVFLLISVGLSHLVYSQAASEPYTFTLKNESVTSAGVYDSDSTLIRTLWSTINYSAGTFPIQWDGKDDQGEQVAKGKYIVKVVSNNVNYKWEGVIGNTSTNQTGSTVHRQFYYSMTDMVIVNGKAFFCSGYSEARPSVASFFTAKPQEKVNVFDHYITNKNTDFVASDGITNYWAGYDPYVNDGTSHSFVSGTVVGDNKDVTFAAGIYFKPQHARGESAIGLVKSAGAMITGLAVQRKGKFLFISRAGLNLIYVLNKTTGAIVRTINLKNPGRLCIDFKDDIWVTSDKNSIVKYNVTGDGSLISTGVEILGVDNPGAIAVNSDNSKVFVIDYTTQQIKIFSNLNGSADDRPTLGIFGGYLSNGIVVNDKFCFSTVANGDLLTSITFDQADGSFWVNDPGNNRIQHFASDRSFIETIMFLPPSYSTWVDKANISRVGAEWLEFNVDYEIPLEKKGSWKFVRNWGAVIPSIYDSFQKFKSIHTYVYEGVTKTFGFLLRRDNTGYELVELQADGIIRFTGILKAGYIIDDEGNLYVGLNKHTPSGFDGSNNITWNPLGEVLADISKIADMNPIRFTSQPFQQPPITSTNKVIFFNPDINRGTETGTDVTGQHLGAIVKGGNKWLWKTEQATSRNYSGDYPGAGHFELGNNVNNNAGSNVNVQGRFIITGYHGEFWKNGQTNKYNIYLDNGLAIGQFGTDFTFNNGEAPAMMAGNALTPTVVKGVSDSEMYLWHGDESYHAGLHRWKISGLNTVLEQSIVVDNPSVAITPTSIPGMDLLAGLPYKDVVQDGHFGWNRTSKENYENFDNKYWTVRTGVKSNLKNALDLYIAYRQESGSQTVTRDLGANTKLDFWNLSGVINFEGNVGNAQNGGGGCYMDIVDDQGKTIIRFYTKETYTNDFDHSTHIHANDKILVEGSRDIIKLVTQKNQPFEIVASDGVLNVKYGNYSIKTSSLFDPGANWKNPKTFRLYFWTKISGENFARIIDIGALRFNNKKAFQNIAFNDLSTIAVGQSPQILKASSSSGLPVSYKIISGPAKVVRNIITVLGIGNITVQAEQEGDNVFDAALPVIKNFTVISTTTREAL